MRQAAALVLITALLGACSYSTGAEESSDEGLVTVPDPPGEGPSTPSSEPPAIPFDGGALEPGECRVVTYTPPTASRSQEGDLCRPSSEARGVGVLLLHGGGGTSGDRGSVSAWADQYLDAGFVTFAIDYTLFAPGVDSPVFPQPEQNAKAAVQYLRGTASRTGIDPDSIVVQGFSAGARIGAVAHTTSGDDWFAGPELWPGIPDHVDAFVGFYSTYDGTMNNDPQYYGGLRDDPDPEVRRAWMRADSIANGRRSSGPVALFTGELDWIELVGQQEALARAVREAGHEAHTSVALGAEHGYDSAGGTLTPQGLIDATFLVSWLDQLFAQ